MGTKSISSTLTVNTVEDGVSQPSYMQTQEAWSNQTTSASSSTMPSDCQESDWKDYTPTKDKTYLWRRSRTMTLNSNKQYVAGSWTYQRLSGDNGTSINPKGSIDYAYSSKSGFPPASSSLAGKTAVAKGSNKIYRCDVPQPGYYDWLETGSTASAGDSYTVDAGNLNGSYQSTDNMHGHLIMWSSEASQWIDLGLFQGESGKTYYTHIAWATGTTDPTQQHPAPSPASGQTSIPNKYAVTGFSIVPFSGAKWMGVLVNQTVADSTTANLYTWSYSKGDDAVNYKISLAGSQFAVDPNQSGGQLHINITGKVYKIVGNNMSAYTDLVDTYLSLYFEDSNGSKDYLTTSDFTVSGATFATTYYDGLGWSDERLFVAILTVGGVEVARESIQIEVWGMNGSNGQRGKMSRFNYYAGLWSEVANTTFSVDDYQAPYVNIGTEDSPNCKVFVGSNGTHTFPSTVAGYNNSSNWESMTTDFKYLITQAIFSQFAHLGASIINGDYMMSQYVIAVGFDNTKQNVDDSTKYIYVESNDVFAEDSLDDYEDTEKFPLIWTPFSSDDYLSVYGYSYSNSACISFNLQMNWGGCMYTCQIEYWSSGSSLDWKIGEQPSSGTVIAQGQLPEYNYDYVTYNTNTFFITLVTPSASSSLKMFFKLSSTEGSVAKIKSIIIRRVKFTPTNCLDMLVGKIVANKLVARGQLYAESFFFETLNGGGNNNVLVVNRESIITLSKDSQGSTVLLPTPTQDIIGRVIEIFCGQDYRDQSSNSPSWFLSFRGMRVTTSSTDENRFISPLKTGGTIWGRFWWAGGAPWQTYVRTTDLGHITYVKMVCVYGGNNKYYWSVIKAEQTYVVNLTPRGSSSAMPLSVTTNWFVNDSAV